MDAYFCSFNASYQSEQSIEIDVNQIVAYQEFERIGKFYTRVWLHGCGNNNPFELAGSKITVIDAMIRASEEDGDGA